MDAMSEWKRTYIDSFLADESTRAAACRMAFTHGYTLTDIEVQTGWTLGQITEAIMSAMDPK